MAEQVQDASELQERLYRSLRVRTTRAVIWIIEVPPVSRNLAEEACLGALARARAQTDARAEVERVDVRRDSQSLARLATLNRERDALLATRRAIVLFVPDAASMRVLRETAPDLTASADVWIALAPPRDRRHNWEACAGAIRRTMIERHQSLDFTGLLPGTVEKRTVPLEEVFLDLVRLPDEAAFATAPGSSRTDRRGVLVLADPGAGKTTYVRHLALTYARGDADPLHVGALTPLLLPLADYAADRERNRVRPLAEFLPDWLADGGVESAAELADHFGDVLLLLDGLDEMREPQARRAVLDEVAGLVSRSAVGGAVVTGRSFLIDELREADVQRLRIASCRPPSPAEVKSYLTHFATLRGDAQARRTARVLSERIQGDPDLRDLVRTPLLLLFLALLHELEGRLPDRRVEIYNRLGELLVERWVLARSLASDRRVRGATRGDALRVLGPLAWWIVERGGGAVDETEMAAKLVDIELQREERAEAERRARDLLDLLKRDSALLRPEPGKRWAFVHPSVAEFFAGRDAERDPRRWDALVADPFRAEWREIVLFAAGIAGVERGNTARLDEIVEAVRRGARRAGRYDARHPSLLVGLLREDPALSGRQRRDLVERLLEFWFVNSFAPHKARQVQMEAVAFLEWGADSPVRDVVAARLGAWFHPVPTSRIRWERVLEAAPALFFGEEQTRLLVTQGVWAVEVAITPLVGALPRLLERYGVPGDSVLDAMAGHAEWPLRLAAGHLRQTGAAAPPRRDGAGADRADAPPMTGGQLTAP